MLPTFFISVPIPHPRTPYRPIAPHTGASGKTQGRVQRGGGALACSRLLSLKISIGAVCLAAPKAGYKPALQQ
jgi:hypothetical protein